MLKTPMEHTGAEGNFRKDTEIVRKNQMELREIKNNVTEIKNAFDGLISRMNRTDKSMVNLKTFCEITHTESIRQT